MNAGRDVERLISDWFASDAPVRAPDRVLEQASSVIDRTKQRRLGAAWRVRFMELTTRRVFVPRTLLYVGILALLVVALTAALLVVGATQRRLPEPFGPARNGIVAYDSNGSIYFSNPDGTGVREVEGGLGYSFSPAFSPDGTKVAFRSRRSTTFGPVYLFVGPADGSAPAVEIGGQAAMTDPDFVPPSWSPDGSRIAFTGYGLSTEERALYVANIDGSAVEKIAEGNIRNSFPRWSPDGSWIAFRTVSGTATGLDLVAPDGTGRRELLSVPGEVDAFTFMSWSADSTRIVYHADTGGRMLVAVTDLEGNVTPIYEPGENAQTPGWSPDGRLIAFDADPTGLVVVEPDGSDRRELGRIAACGMWFSPDSTYVLAHAPECFTDELVVVPIDDPSRLTQLQLPADTVGMPAWQRTYE